MYVEAAAEAANKQQKAIYNSELQMAFKSIFIINIQTHLLYHIDSKNTSVNMLPEVSESIEK